MPIDLQRILEAAVRAAVVEPAQAAPISGKAKKRRLSTGRAMLLGAGLATAGRLVVSHKGRDVLDRVQQRLGDSKWLEDQEPEEVEDYEDEVSEPELDEVGEEELADEGEDDSQEAEPKPPVRRRRGRA